MINPLVDGMLWNSLLENFGAWGFRDGGASAVLLEQRGLNPPPTMHVRIPSIAIWIYSGSEVVELIE